MANHDNYCTCGDNKAALDCSENMCSLCCESSECPRHGEGDSHVEESSSGTTEEPNCDTCHTNDCVVTLGDDDCEHPETNYNDMTGSTVCMCCLSRVSGSDVSDEEWMQQNDVGRDEMRGW